jgi:hypothetical protein
VLRQVGTTFVVPNGRLYTPVDGAVAVPTVDRDIPILGCARAAVLKRANTVATIVVSFMADSLSHRSDGGQPQGFN